jgi:hypothetical protein
VNGFRAAQFSENLRKGERGRDVSQFKYSYRDGVRVVIDGQGLYGAWVSGHLAPEMMPDAETRSIAEGLNAAFSYVGVFEKLLRAAVGAAPDDSVIDANGVDYDKDVA